MTQELVTQLTWHWCMSAWIVHSPLYVFLFSVSIPCRPRTLVSVDNSHRVAAQSYSTYLCRRVVHVNVIKVVVTYHCSFIRFEPTFRFVVCRVAKCSDVDNKFVLTNGVRLEYYSRPPWDISTPHWNKNLRAQAEPYAILRIHSRPSVLVARIICYGHVAVCVFVTFCIVSKRLSRSSCDLRQIVAQPF